MRKYAVLVVLMAFVIAVTSSCGLIVKDPEVDAQTVIIEVADKTFVKADVKQALENVLDYQEYIYYLYGYSYDRTDPDVIAAAQETAINSIIEGAVTDQKIAENGLDQFTDEELAAINETVDDTYTTYVENIQSTYFEDTELTGDELEEAIVAKMLELGYGSRDDMLEQEIQSKQQAKLRDMIVKDIVVSEEEIKVQYDLGVSDAISTYTSNLSQYATDLNNGKIIYLKPEGYRFVKNLLIKIASEDETQIASLNTQIANDQESLAATQTAIEELPEDPTADTEDQQKTRAELTTQIETLTAEIESLTQQLDELTTSAYGAIQPTVDAVLTRIEAGDAFDALIEEYGEDTGMTVEPAKTDGYLVCNGMTGYLEEFVNTSMALKKIGDISDPFRTRYGVHIVQYANDLEAGEVPLADIHDQISEELLGSKQDTEYEETITQWVTDANAKIHMDKLAD